MADPVTSHAFVGRSTELERLARAFRTAQASEASAVIVGGEAGIGKSRLIEAFIREARAAGATVLVGACLEFAEAGPPYGPFVEALRTLVRASDPARLPALIGPWRSELARLLPELEPRLPDAAPHEFDRSAQARLFEIVLGVFERLARTTPVVLVIEDLHWADESTRGLLGFLVRNLRAAPVLFLISVRSDELHRRHPVLPFLAELEREERVDRLELRPFRRPEMADLLTALLRVAAPAALVDTVLARTDGNPFFAEQLIEAFGEDGLTPTVDDLPPRLRDVLIARVSSLSDLGQEVLRAASAAGRRTDDALLAAVLELPEREVAVALREAVGRGILVDADRGDGRDSGYAFRHALLREVIYAELFTGERRRLHGRFATALGDRGEVGGNPVGPADVAYHLDAARDYRRALPALIEAGRAAEGGYAFAEAGRWYERALDVWSRVEDPEALVASDRVTLLQRAAEVQVLLGQHDRAIALGREAIAAHADEAVDEPILAAHLRDRMRWFLWEAGDRDAATAAVHEALALLPVDPPSAARALALSQLGGVHLHAGRYVEAAAAAHQAIEVARAVQAHSGEARSEEALALGVLGWSTAILGDVEGGIARYREGLAIAYELRGAEGIALAHAELARLLGTLGLAERALEAAEEGVAITRRMGLERTYGGMLQGHRCDALFELGRWSEMAATLADAGGHAPMRQAAVWLEVNRARLAIATGRPEDAAEAIGGAVAAAEEVRGTWLATRVLAARIEQGLASSSLADVRRLVDEAWAGIDAGTLPDPALAWAACVALRLEADAAERARARHDEALTAEILGRTRAMTMGLEAVAGRIAAALAAGLAAGGATATAAGRDDVGGRPTALLALARAEAQRAEGRRDASAWAATADAWAAIGRPYPAAYARLRQAEAMVATRDQRTDAQAALRAAHATAVELGAAPLRSEIELLARQARLELTVAAPGTVDASAAVPAADAGLGFTEREREVLRLVAGGWSNQQIADTLYITRKTASVHVSNILGKLGVGSRVEAAAIAHRLGLAADAPSPPDSDAVA